MFDDYDTLIFIGVQLITFFFLLGYFKARVETRLYSIDKRLDQQNGRIEKCEDRLIEHIEVNKK